MNHRLTVTAAIAVAASSVSLFAVIAGNNWFFAGIGAVIIVALAGTATRLPSVPAAATAAALALLAGYPLLASGSWYAIAGGGLLVAAAAASVTRLGLLRVLAAAITYFGALLVYLNLVDASRESLFRIVPTPSSLRHLAYLAGQGLAERSSAPPVPGHAGVALLAAGGIGIIAVATDLIAVRLRSPAVAGLPLLLLFSVPVTTNVKDAGLGEAVAFCLGISGFLALLAADGRERLRLWGRLVTVWHGPDESGRGPDTKALATSGRRVGLAAVSLAVVAPLLLPSLHVRDLFHGSSALGDGGGPAWLLPQLPEPLVQLQGQLLSTSPQAVLTYRTNDLDAADHYLQVFVLNYDGFEGKWELVPPTSGSQPVSGQRSLLPATGVTAAIHQQTVRLRIKMAQVTGSGYGGKVGFVPLPYAPYKLQVPGDWREDDATLMVYSGQSSLRGLTYSVASKEADPTRQQLDSGPATLPPTGEQSYLSFPAPQRAALRKLALTITSRAKTPYEEALALQNWFLVPGRFHYSLRPSLPNTTAGLLDFLTKDRRGYCQQFAFAMAALARLLGIPSRIAVGYTGGLQQSNGTWQVSTDDAHAWPELYFERAGWLRFEPTPGGTGGQGTATEPNYASPAVITPQNVPPPATGATSSLPGQRTPGGHGGSKLVGGTGATGPAGSAGHRGTGLALPLALAAAIALALAAIGLRAARFAISRRRWRRAHDDAGLAGAAWRELRDDLADLGLGVRASESPRAVAARIAADQGLPTAARDALRRIASAVERARYAAAPEPAGTLRADVTIVRKALWMQAARRTRWRATVLPASTLRPVRAALRQWLDIFGRLDVTRARMRRSPGSA
jgi:transglutaminase-like putative cysteine protease